MFPTTPLHHLLFAALLIPLVATGNLSDEPIAIDDAEALARLGRIADLFSPTTGRSPGTWTTPSASRRRRPRLVRRARGYAPLPSSPVGPRSSPLGAPEGDGRLSSAGRSSSPSTSATRDPGGRGASRG